MANAMFVGTAALSCTGVMVPVMVVVVLVASVSPVRSVCPSAAKAVPHRSDRHAAVESRVDNTFFFHDDSSLLLFWRLAKLKTKNGL